MTDFSTNHARPDANLWQSVLLRAVMDALSESTGREARRDKRDADRWLRHGGSDFAFVCTNAGFDPDAIREKYAAGDITMKSIEGTRNILGNRRFHDRRMEEAA